MKLVPEPSRTLAADRRELPVTMQLAVVAATAASVGLAARLLPVEGRDPTLATVGGAIAGALAVAGLRSIPIRTASRWMCVIGALIVLRFGSSSTDDLGAWAALGWIIATVTALVLSARTERWLWRRPQRPLPASTGHVDRGGREHRRRRGDQRHGGRRLIRIVVVVVCLVSAAAMGFGPAVAAGFSTGSRVGDRPSFGRGTASSALAASDRLDMTRRPRLSDAVVLTIRTDRIGFVRSQTFDVWNGAVWTRSRPELAVVPASGRIVPDPYDLAATEGTVIRQEFRLAAPYASSLPVAPSAVSVTSPPPLDPWDDGSVVTEVPLGEGATYSVVSRQRTDLTEDVLRRTAGVAVPDVVRERYATPPPATSRVKRLAEQITAGEATPFDKVQAIDEWLASNTKYSLDAPLAPSDADVVDDFLFNSRVGWCEQIATSFTVLARSMGIPARLATGYVPEGRDPITQRYVVRERDAHAWAEVWFPEVGWVQFDPTARVPLGGQAGGDSTVTWLARYGAWALLAIAVVVAFAAPAADGLAAALRRLRSGWSRGRIRRRRSGLDGWPAETEAVLERIGERWGRARAPAETATSYAGEVGLTVGDPRVSKVGVLIDRARFAQSPPSEDERRDVEGLLNSIASRAAETIARDDGSPPS